MVDLSIIIVSFNTKKLTRETIGSVIRNTKGIDYEFIVVDNDSKDGSVESLQKLASKYKNIKLILNKENSGFGQGNNQGMKIASGRHFLLLNSDTLVESNVLGEMVAYLDKNPKIGIASCGLRFKDGGIQGTGGYFPTLGRVLMWMFFLDDIPFLMRLVKPFHPMHGLSPFDKNISFFKEKKQMDWVTGAFLMLRREVFDATKGFDKDYFMYVEEVDWCYRAKKLGWEIWYLPKWHITHYGGASSTSEFPLINEVKSLKVFYRKHMDPFQTLILRVLVKIGSLLRIFIFGILRGKDAAKTYAKIFLTA